MREKTTSRRSRRMAAGPPDSPFEPLPSWRLPSGLELVEFALQGGFLMPALMESGERRDVVEEASLAGGKR